MTRGLTTRRMKSFGYENPAEHYFNYIDKDFQNADNTVLPFPRGGFATRNTNKTSAKKTKTRVIV